MSRSFLMLLVLSAGVYFYVKRPKSTPSSGEVPHEADAQWANEGGANAPDSV